VVEDEREAVAAKYASLEKEASRKEKERQKEFEHLLAETVDSFERQSKAFIESLEDKALKSKLDKERAARKAELNRAVVSKVQGPRSKIGDVGTQAESRPVGGVPVVDGEVVIGSRVITSFGTSGTVEKLDGETAEVLVGNMRLREKLDNLRLAEASSAVQAETRPVGRVSSSAISKPVDTPDAPAELNLIGKTTAEAEYELDRFIDEAYMASLPRVRIIHGFGTGALKNYVHHFLKDHELVERYAFAPDNQGGNGATIAELKL